MATDGNLDLDKGMKNILNSEYVGIYKHFKISLKDNCLKQKKCIMDFKIHVKVKCKIIIYS